ncbi:MAG: hypothetical protein O3B21_06350 [Proteobacteria bacterium]|nr:hypothetical protein [Pseudomonadota bacterium]MDA1354652.1 hypothetical protein [Pseudomonadota bacterium]
MTKSFVSDARQAGETLVRLAEVDAASLPLLAADELPALLSAAVALPFRTVRNEIGSGAALVRQDFDICMAPPKPGALWDLAARLEAYLAHALGAVRQPLLTGPLRLNDLVAQRYPPGSLGITAHRDHARYTGLVGLILLSGNGRFFVCETRSGKGAREILWRPGELLLMRAPGFAGRDDRPFHYLSDITSQRYSLGLRHDTQPG